MIDPVGPPPPPTPDPDVDEGLPAEWRVYRGSGQRFRERIRGNAPLQVGIAMLLGYAAVALVALQHFGNGLQDLRIDPAFANSLSPPGPQASHPFGVMGGIGIDIFWALIQATPVDLALIGGSILLAVVVGLLLGAYAGFVGGPVDLVVTFVSDLLSTVPPFFFVMVMFLGLQPFIQSPSFLLYFGGLYALVLWPYHARPVRARALQVSGEPYVEAAKAAGGGTGRILWKHVIPNSISPLLAQIPVDVYNFLFVLTVFPFLGCFAGSLFAYLTPLPASTYPEWGYLLATGACYGWSPLSEINHWWMYAFPAAVVIVFGIAVALLCDGAERFLAGARPTR